MTHDVAWDWTEAGDAVMPVGFLDDIIGDMFKNIGCIDVDVGCGGIDLGFGGCAYVMCGTEGVNKCGHVGLDTDGLYGSAGSSMNGPYVGVL